MSERFTRCRRDIYINIYALFSGGSHKRQVRCVVQSPPSGHANTKHTFLLLCSPAAVSPLLSVLLTDLAGETEAPNPPRSGALARSTACVHTHIHTHMCTNTHTQHRQTPMCKHTHRNICVHARTHTHTHTNTHTHTHTHTREAGVLKMNGFVGA